MTSIVETARAKINLALHVLGRRPDGYHELDSIVAFADCGDELRIEWAERNSLQVSGPFAADVPLGEDNIIWKAWAHLNAIVPLPFVSVHLVKNLPVASGIGGGSADAAAMLRGLLRIVGRALRDAQVVALGKELGADVPVCFLGKACRMKGIGEKISVLTEKLPEAIVLVNPRVECSTAQVFATIGLKAGDAFAGGTGLWRNDMTEAAVKVQPVIADVLAALKAAQFDEVRMSGSGATCFGTVGSLQFAQGEAEMLAKRFPRWWVRAARLV